MKRVFCDKCGVLDGGKGSGVRVVEVNAGVRHGGRVLDLCNECRQAFHRILNDWLTSASRAGCASDAPKLLAVIQAARNYANLTFPLSSDERDVWRVSRERLRAALAEHDNPPPTSFEAPKAENASGAEAGEQ